MLAQHDAQARMNRMYRHQRRIYDLTRRYYLLGRTTLIEGLAPPPKGSVLEVGCGTASNLIAAAHRYPSARFYGFDISTEMLTTARLAVKRSGFQTRINLSAGDATLFDGQRLFGERQFDRIFTSYTLSMIADWPKVILEMSRHLAPNGSMHIVDFGDCRGLPWPAKSLLYGWLGKFDVTPRQDLRSALQRFGHRENLRVTHAPLFGGYAQLAVLTRAET